ncbi:MAG: hypothetical protein ACR2KU_00335 [Gammaproteobacteria bacterium]
MRTSTAVLALMDGFQNHYRFAAGPQRLKQSAVFPHGEFGFDVRYSEPFELLQRILQVAACARVGVSEPQGARIEDIDFVEGLIQNHSYARRPRPLGSCGSEKGS